MTTAAVGPSSAQRQPRWEPKWLATAIITEPVSPSQAEPHQAAYRLFRFHVPPRLTSSGYTLWIRLILKQVTGTRMPPSGCSSSPGPKRLIPMTEQPGIRLTA